MEHHGNRVQHFWEEVINDHSKVLAINKKQLAGVKRKRESFKDKGLLSQVIIPIVGFTKEFPTSDALEKINTSVIPMMLKQIEKYIIMSNLGSKVLVNGDKTSVRGNDLITLKKGG